jgi:hypothetical protein
MILDGTLPYLVGYVCAAMGGMLWLSGIISVEWALLLSIAIMMPSMALNAQNKYRMRKTIKKLREDVKVEPLPVSVGPAPPEPIIDEDTDEIPLIELRPIPITLIDTDEIEEVEVEETETEEIDTRDIGLPRVPESCIKPLDDTDPAIIGIDVYVNYVRVRTMNFPRGRGILEDKDGLVKHARKYSDVAQLLRDKTITDVIYAQNAYLQFLARPE